MSMLRAIACLAICLLSPCVSKAAEILYAATGSGGVPGTLYSVNPSSGAATPVGSIGYAVTGLAWDPGTGTLFGSTANNDASAPGSLLSINTATGLGTLIGSFGISGQSMADLTFSNGLLYGWAESSADDLFTINPSTGAAALVGDAGLSTFGSGLAASPGGVLYLTGNGIDGELRTVDSGTGITSVAEFLSGGVGESESIKALAFNSAGTLYGVGGSGTGPTVGAALITINTSNGFITTVGALPTATDALAFVDDAVTNPVPEPATPLLIAPAVAAIAFLYGRRRS